MRNIKYQYDHFIGANSFSIDLFLLYLFIYLNNFFKDRCVENIVLFMNEHLVLFDFSG